MIYSLNFPFNVLYEDKIYHRDRDLYYVLGLMPMWLIIQKYGSKIKGTEEIVGIGLDI